MSESRYAYQMWHCAHCETKFDEPGSVVEEDSHDGDAAMRCEVCGLLFTARGEWVPDEEDTDV